MAAGENLALLTDLYQLTMAQSYFRERKLGLATFSLFIRSYPLNRGYFVAAGLRDVIEYLESFSFDAAALDHLSTLDLFTEDFLHFLSGLSFTGDVWALPEGRVFFTDEPILEVTAPIIEAQIVETIIINQINLQTLIATKAARCVHAAAGRAVVDFALRRTHGADAGIKVARDSFIAGFAGTSNVAAAHAYGLPAVGTMAHSYIEAFDDEEAAFRSFITAHPGPVTLLVDTYDTLAGTRVAARVLRDCGLAEGCAVRLDSGNLGALAVNVRRILDGHGLPEVRIVASGGLDEYEIDRLVRLRAPIDSFAVGTHYGVSADAPYLDAAYKLVQYDGRPMMKLSRGKATAPGAKQVFRAPGFEDTVALREEPVPSGRRGLLTTVMEQGRRTAVPPPVSRIRDHLRAQIAELPPEARWIVDPLPPAATRSDLLRELTEASRHRLERRFLG